MSVVIIGGGQAGTEAAFSLRSGGYTKPITIISQENLPYQRPPLSKEYLKGDGDIDDVIIRPPSFYAGKQIDLRRDVTAVRIELDRRQVTAHNGELFRYDRLILATGAAPITLDQNEAGTIPTHVLRGLDDSERLRAILMSGSDQHILVAGSGFIGLEVAAAAARHGNTVTLLCRADRVMRRSVTETTARVFERAHMLNGVDIRFGTQFVGMDPAHADAMLLSDGSSVRTDHLVVGIGVEPDDSLAINAGLTCAAGIVVDRTLRTSDPRVSAIGDCAVSACYGGLRRVESVQNAVDQARYVAKQIIADDHGHPPVGEFSAVPWFWTEQWGLKLQIAGIIDDRIDSVVLRGRTCEDGFSAFCYAGDELTAVESINRPRDHLAARKLLGQKISLPAELAADEHVDLRELVSRESIPVLVK